MGKADFKKVNDRWYTDEDSRNKTNDFYLSEEPSTGKKKKKKKSSKRSDHKHSYIPVLLRADWTSKYSWVSVKQPHYSLGKKCEICGKILIDKYFITEKNEKGYYTTLTEKEILKKYKDLEIVFYEEF